MIWDGRREVFLHQRESERDAGNEVHIYATECSRRIASLADLEQIVQKSPEPNAEEEHMVNRYEQEEQEENDLRDYVIPSNQEGGGS